MVRMSYRIYVNDYQCLGNNECPKVLIDELKRQGCKMNEDGCFHDFEIKELQPIIEALEKYIIDMNNWALNKTYNSVSIADFSDLFSKPGSNGLTWNVQYNMRCGYLFVTVNFLNAIKDDYEEDYSGERIIYKIKEGHHIYMSGY